MANENTLDKKENTTEATYPPEEKQYMTTKAQGTNKKTITVEVPEGYNLSDFMPELKTQRIQLLMTPSLARGAKAKASYLGLSLNEYMSVLVKRDLRRTRK